MFSLEEEIPSPLKRTPQGHLMTQLLSIHKTPPDLSLGVSEPPCISFSFRLLDVDSFPPRGGGTPIYFFNSCIVGERWGNISLLLNPCFSDRFPLKMEAPQPSQKLSRV